MKPTYEELERERNDLAAQVERLQNIPYTKTRSEFMEAWCVDGMPADKKRLVIAAWDRAEWLFNRQVERLRTDILEEIENRDISEAAADSLANEIARFFGIDIGEHSSDNSPWDNAFEVVPDTTLAALKSQWQAEAITEFVNTVGDSDYMWDFGDRKDFSIEYIQRLQEPSNANTNNQAT